MDWTVLARLAVAAGLAMAIGIDRELRSKPAGLRTNIVVSVAAGAFAYLGAESFGGGDPTRVASQVVSGIGFLGGGAIFAAGGKPHGLTTAAALWGSAAIGIASGTGNYDVAIVVVVVTLITLWPLDLLSDRVLSRIGRKDLRVHVVLEDRHQLTEIQGVLGPASLRVLEVDIETLGEGLVFDMVISGTPRVVDTLLYELRGIEGAVVVTNVAMSASSR